ncbi:hypothetical protein GH714_012921 [Hevea brasiliensis]|uniref:WIYLD domain-containing protein n=1 Tax=Hevea brasiliensis TaxID=3981 RepID=A0A6A6MYZ9_HEVBR|nr:hypothetical protein GH714_012921 [Hevea brasiliensis]
MSKASVVTTQISFASAASIIATKLQYSSTKNTAAINDMKARDWTPVDDDIEVYLYEFLDRYRTPRKEVDAFIHKILHAPTARKRLPVFSEFCTRQARDRTTMDDDMRFSCGQMRMDAALDAMMSYGFPEELIVTTVKELLDVYGMDGWPFIEEASYRVLLDSILEKVEKEAKEKGDSPPSGGRDGNNTKASCAGPSSEALVHTYSSEEALLQSNVNLDIASDTDNNKAPVTALRADGFASTMNILESVGLWMRYEIMSLDFFYTATFKNEVPLIVTVDKNKAELHPNIL